MATARVREALEAERVQEEVLALTRGEPARPVTVAMAMAVILMTPERLAGAARVPAARRTTSPPRLDGATTSARETEAERAAMSANMDLSSTHPFTQPPAAEFALPSLNLFLWISTKKRSARWVMGGAKQPQHWFCGVDTPRRAKLDTVRTSTRALSTFRRVHLVVQRE